MESLYEVLVAQLIDNQYCVANEFLEQGLVSALRTDLLSLHEKGLMKPAGIGQNFNFERNLKVRGDVIFWLEKEHSPAQKAFLEKLEGFIEYLNRTCYAGIRSYEFHFAYYETGSFYKRHLDQFKSNLGRKFSLVCYLNEGWLPENGGQLTLFPNDSTSTVEVLPLGGNAVFFRADELEHEVSLTHKPRLSIAGWLKV